MFLIGCVLTVIVFFVTGVGGQVKDTSEYKPAIFKDGQVIDGAFKDPQNPQ
ncbi:MAG: hypothetical protein AAF403_07915 [Pseudomonadota bacterium]